MAYGREQRKFTIRISGYTHDERRTLDDEVMEFANRDGEMAIAEHRRQERGA